MITSSFSNSYSSYSRSGGWWRKNINPAITFIILTVVMVTVFVMGALFMKEYVKIWSKISQKEQEMIFEDEDGFEQLILP